MFFSAAPLVSSRWGPLIIYKDGAFQGEHSASCIIQRAAERKAAASCFKRKQSETVRTPQNGVHSHQKVPPWWMEESGSRICYLPVAHAVKEHLLYLESRLLFFNSAECNDARTHVLKVTAAHPCICERTVPCKVREEEEGGRDRRGGFSCS